MNCPSCANQMTVGKVSVEGTAAGFMVFGLSHQHCYFKPDDGGEKVMTIYTGDERPGFRCSCCGLVVIEMKESRKEQDKRLSSALSEHNNIT